MAPSRSWNCAFSPAETQVALLLLRVLVQLLDWIHPLPPLGFADPESAVGPAPLMQSAQDQMRNAAQD